MDPAKGIGIRKIMDERLEEVKKEKGVELDTEFLLMILKN
jgi:pyruvate,orthophosphate dikinase